MTSKADYMRSVPEWKKERLNRKIADALEALPHVTPGDWWTSERGELLNDPVGNAKISNGISGYGPTDAKANQALLRAAPELALSVIQLRAQLLELREAVRLANVALMSMEGCTLTLHLDERTPCFKTLWPIVQGDIG